ncbi:TPA: hypothetical protein QDB01_000317 [Burkholderia vietnamiensis]|nr:hypothetical protein [Burkholderia vietnamiensis]
MLERLLNLFRTKPTATPASTAQPPVEKVRTAAAPAPTLVLHDAPAFLSGLTFTGEDGMGAIELIDESARDLPNTGSIIVDASGIMQCPAIDNAPTIASISSFTNAPTISISSFTCPNGWSILGCEHIVFFANAWVDARVYLTISADDVASVRAYKLDEANRVWFDPTKIRGHFDDIEIDWNDVDPETHQYLPAAALGAPHAVLDKILQFNDGGEGAQAIREAAHAKYELDKQALIAVAEQAMVSEAEVEAHPEAPRARARARL